MLRRRMFRPIQVPLRYRTPVQPQGPCPARPQVRGRRHDPRAAAKPGEPGYDPTRDDLVTRLREARDPDTGEPISEDELRDQALIFLMAGHETTAGALTFTLHLLGRHPEIQDRVADEIRDGAGRRARAHRPSRSVRSTYTRAALMEGMRLYPSAHATERSTVEALTLGGYRLPPQPDRHRLVRGRPIGTREFWPEPERFDPERFLATTTGRATPTSRSAAGRARASVSTSRCSSRWSLLAALLREPSGDLAARRHAGHPQHHAAPGRSGRAGDQSSMTSVISFGTKPLRP